MAVVAYDDRSITLDGKPVVGKDGGTFRATGRMIDALRQGRSRWPRASPATFVTHTGLDGRIAMYVHPNPDNRILHTALVGEMNGLLRVLTDGDPPAPVWGTFGGPRAYTKWVQPAPAIPHGPRMPRAAPWSSSGSPASAPADREEAIARELLRGNICPDFLRKFQAVTIRGKDKAAREHTATVEVMPDYLAVGSDTDFVRVPMTPQTAQRDRRRLRLCAADPQGRGRGIPQARSVKLEPIPLTEAREAVETFADHNRRIEKQRDRTSRSARWSRALRRTWW